MNRSVRQIPQLLRRRAEVLLCCLLLLASLCPNAAGAAEQLQQTVRVGYYANDYFQ